MEEKEPKDTKEELEKLQKEKDEYLAGWQRAKADFLNYKKEEGERMQNAILFTQDEILYNLLPVLDNLERAEKHIPEEKKEDQGMQGFLQIGKQIKDFLKSKGVEEMEIGKAFDPNFHEAVEAKEEEGRESGEIIGVLEKGYMRNGEVLRVAKVRVVK